MNAIVETLSDRTSGRSHFGQDIEIEIALFPFLIALKSVALILYSLELFLVPFNTEAVPPGERVYPQHLIGVAIELLLSCEVDWSQIKNAEDLKRLLNL